MIATGLRFKPTPKLAAAGGAGVVAIVAAVIANATGLPVDVVSMVVGVGVTWVAGWIKRDRTSPVVPERSPY